MSCPAEGRTRYSIPATVPNGHNAGAALAGLVEGTDPNGDSRYATDVIALPVHCCVAYGSVTLSWCRAGPQFGGGRRG